MTEIPIPIRTLVLTQDTILTAEFAQSFSGQCGENLYWELIESTLHITGSGEMYDYTSDTAPWKVLVSSIKSLTIAEGVTSIGSYAFYNCFSLTSVTIGESVTSIGRSAFRGCSSLTSVTIPNSVTSIGDYAFYNCSKLTLVTINSNAIVSKDYSYNSNISHIFGSQVTEYIIGDDAKGIGDYAFAGCSSLTSVTLPNSMKSIGSWAFEDCSSLTSITIPNSVTSIGSWAFEDCSSLTSVTIPNSVTSIGNGAFSGCSSLTSITIPNSVTSIGSGAFNICSSLTSVTINSNAIVSKDYRDNFNISHIFGSQVTEYIIGDDVNGIGSYAFYDCSSLISVTIPNSVTSIGDDAFYKCSKLTKTNYTGDIAGWCNIKFGSYGANPMCYSHNFYINDQEIKDLVIPNSVTSIGDWAFYYCSSLTSMTIGNSVTSIGKSAFEGCSGLTSVTIPNGVTSIKSSTFYKCSSLKSVTTPNSLKTIGTYAFGGCDRLGEMKLGTGLEEIAANAFAGCTRLYDIYVYATYPPFAEESSFANYNVYVYIPCEYQRDYILDVVWGKFKFIECIDSEEATTDGNVTVVPGFNDVTITWPTEGNADTYTIVIKKGNEVFCTLTFNAEGQLLNIAFAPGRDGNHPAQYAEQAGKGYRFTVTSLESGTKYGYNIDMKDASNKTIKSHSGEFTTQSTTAVDNITTNNANIQKIMRDGQFIIVRDGVEYNAMGQEVGN